jgi:signal transduction histidine kinase
MKLFTRYLRINLFATLVIFVLASMAFYFLLWHVTLGQVDEDLKIEKREIESYINKYHRTPEPMNVKDQNMSFEKTAENYLASHFKTIRPAGKSEDEDFREISFTLPVNNEWYVFRVSKSLERTQNLNQSIIIISLITIILILLVSLLINRWQLGRLWKPFYSTLAGIEKFRIGTSRTPKFESGTIDEFNLLNSTLNLFIQDAEKDYKSLKEFTENASHELQTPLAIVRSTLDVLIQDEKLSETQINTLQTAYSAIQKMSKLNQSLLLLNKIDNRQFSDIITIDFKTLVEQKMNDWQELWQGRNLQITAFVKSTLVVLNEQLAEIMLNNLFSNAARHTAAGGLVSIRLEEKIFEISNSAAGGPLDPEKLFKRFSKGGQDSDHHGLGLSIVKQITEVSGTRISYRYAENRHYFSVYFQAQD